MVFFKSSVTKKEEEMAVKEVAQGRVLDLLGCAMLWCSIQAAFEDMVCINLGCIGVGRTTC